MQREIGIIIKVKDAAKAKQEIKSIVDNQVLDQVKKFNEQLKQTGTQVERTGTKAKEAAGGLDKFFRTAVKGTGILYTLQRGLSFAMASFEQGAGLDRAGKQFEASIGRVNETLPQLRAATRGTVEDMKLLQTANRAVMEGLNPKKLVGMYQMATVASRKLGLDTEQSIQTISNAIVRQDESALATLGTILKTNIGLKIQNALIAKNGGVMSGAMAVQIRQGVIMDELNRRFGGFNKLQEDGVEVLEKFRAAMSNLRMSIGQALGSALTPLLKVVTSMAQGMADFLNSVKDTAGFKAFIQYATVLAGIFTAKGLLGGIMKAAKYLGVFTIGLKGAAAIAAGFIGFKALGGDLSQLSGFAEKAQTAFSVLFQLLGNYDANSGLTKVLTKDKEALGGFYNVVFQGAKIFLGLKAVVTGVFNGIASVLKSVAPLFGSFGEGIVEAMQAISNGQPILQSTLNKLERLGEVAGKAAVAFAAVYGAGSLMGMTKYFATLILQIGLATKAYWGMAAAWAAANPLTALAVGTGAALYFGDKAADSMGLNVDKGYDQRGYPRASSESESAPAPRAQNIEASSSMNADDMLAYLSSIAKDTRRNADSNEALVTKEDQKMLQDNANKALAPFTMNFGKP